MYEVHCPARLGQVGLSSLTLPLPPPSSSVLHALLCFALLCFALLCLVSTTLLKCFSLLAGSLRICFSVCGPSISLYEHEYVCA